MPTYDYECETCGAELEIQQSVKEEPRTSKFHKRADHPRRSEATCDGPLKRVIKYAPGLVKRGGGWTPRFHG